MLDALAETLGVGGGAGVADAVGVGVGTLSAGSFPVLGAEGVALSGLVVLVAKYAPVSARTVATPPATANRAMRVPPGLCARFVTSSQ